MLPFRFCNHSGHIDVDELAAGITELSIEGGGGGAPVSYSVSREAARAIIRMLDQNKNGLLEEDEFAIWVKKGTRMSGKQRRKYARSGASKRAAVPL